ncbi:MAG: leucine-rich repeat domain-containing protein, partial [Candidatus Heimdallarchaeota archaeon]|nr:leucine-rich repeat domain-containing protein [Candidatus Heimdallarchaeota archaeon]
SQSRDVTVENTTDISDFEIIGGELIRYNGRKKIVHVPEGIITLSSSSFWNNTDIIEVFLPNSLIQIGGDAFYYCINLERINIPVNVKIMGNNPFAGCPKLKVTNFSTYFVIENEVLLNHERSLLIYYPIAKKDSEYIIPDTITSLGKHSFYNCDNLKKVIIPESVIKFENNIFSDCKNLSIVNKSPNYHVENGIIYNKFKTAIIAVLANTTIEKFIVPDTITLISRNSFWNCKGIKKIVLTKNIKVIGYNPFAGCENLTFETENDNLKVEDGILYNHNYTEIICCTNSVAKKQVTIRSSVKYINRSAFSGCKDLVQIDFNQVIEIAKSAFTNCSSLKNLYIPDNVRYIGEWAFAYCSNLKKVEVNKFTIIDKNAFNECPAEIITRG